MMLTDFLLQSLNQSGDKILRPIKPSLSNLFVLSPSSFHSQSLHPPAKLHPPSPGFFAQPMFPQQAVTTHPSGPKSRAPQVSGIATPLITLQRLILID